MSASVPSWRQQRIDRERLRRQRWADQENEKRRREHDRALSVWHERRMAAEALLARADDAWAVPRLQPGLKLRSGETVVFETDGVSMIDRQDGPRLGGLSDASFSIVEDPLPHAPGPMPLVADSGVVAVTNRRVIFQGNRKREWDFAKLQRFTLLPDGRNLFLVDNRKYLSGVLVPTTAEFRFHVMLAIAEAQGRRRDWMRRFAEQLAAYIASRPVPRPPAVPDDAPPSAPLESWKLPSLVTAVTVMVVLLCMGLFSSGGGDDRGVGTATSAAVAPTSDQPDRTASSPARPELSDALSSAEPEPEPEPEPQSQPAADLCGAPPNPHGYNYCGNGGTVTSPPSDICSYFSCIGNFWNGQGHMIECADGQVSMSGGRSGSCSQHGGNGRTVYSG